ncbi:substrate-binding domain-containing protein [Fluviispira multicolorata]|uniref:Substrate-binding domain-containing protein n=1 Tax=Fluviispira multicolorata TaxID=2654512 RepID=A0A833JE15_9BACT|nr:substrate-binding domain-containing protein [Fluviispira multicolorata]KAB8029705.1 substrate-binding domain-containing protein [Fluviispira multicolorata]
MYKNSNMLPFRFLFIFLLFFFYPLNLQAEEWKGPTDGPKAMKSKYIVFVASDFKNGGVLGVYKAAENAAEEIGWKIRTFDGEGNPERLRKGLIDTLESRPDGIVLGGFQPDDYREVLALARKAKIPVVGWHASENPGAYYDLFVNISTDPIIVAKMATDYIINSGKEKIGVIIFNDSRFAIANAKTEQMKDILIKCEKCKLLSVEDIPLSKADILVPDAVPRLNAKYGAEWTHSLAINDYYYIKMDSPLKSINRKDIINVAAGDGGLKAFKRIKSGESQQIATVGEPLNAQGWQIIDEMNRAFSGEKPSGYVSTPILFSTESLKKIVGLEALEVNTHYKDAYLKIWNKK